MTKTLTIKQAKFVKAKAEGKSGIQAYKEAYNTTNDNVAAVEASRTLHKPNVQEALQAELERQGITLEKIIRPVSNALNAKVRLKSKINDTYVEIDADDVELQLKGHDRAVKLMGLNQSKGDGGNTINNFGTIVNEMKHKYAD